MDREVIAAIISGCAVIIAAIIGGIFVLKKRDKSKETVQTAHTGGHAFQASGNANQHVNITEVIKAEEPTDQLLTTTAEIGEYVNTILIENQQILNPIFAKEPNLGEIRKGMQLLFGIQHDRGKFGDWITFLEHERETEVESAIKDEIKRLIIIIGELHESFYSYIDPKKLNKKYSDKKHFIVTILEKDDVDILEVRTIATDYLEHLRNSVESIGSVNGALRSIKSKPS